MKRKQEIIPLCLLLLQPPEVRLLFRHCLPGKLGEGLVRSLRCDWPRTNIFKTLMHTAHIYMQLSCIARRTTLTKVQVKLAFFRILIYPREEIRGGMRVELLMDNLPLHILSQECLLLSRPFAFQWRERELFQGFCSITIGQCLVGKTLQSDKYNV